MTLDEVFIYLELGGSRSDKCKKYAELLQAKAKGIPRVASLKGDEVSSNGLCEWHKEKAFINKYIHGVEFEDVGHFFEEPPPDNCDVVFDLPDPNSMGINDRVLVRLSQDYYIIISTEGQKARIRLVSARVLSSAEVRKSLSSLTQSSVLLGSSLHSLFDDDGMICVPSEGNAVARRFFDMEDLFINGKISEDFLRVILHSCFGLNEKHTEFWVTGWAKKRDNIERLSKHTYL